jgi:pseudoazurin
MHKLFTAVIGATMAFAVIGGAQAAEVEVKMLNRGATGTFVFEPNLVQIQPGDSVHFVAVDKGHDAVSIKGMLPQGAQPFAGKISQDVTVTFDVPGVYGVECKPHYPMGMVALVVVGKPTNLAEAKAVKHPGKARKVFANLFTKYAATGTAQK